MHVAIATTEFVTEKTFAGGLANYSANLARMLSEHGQDVSVFVISTLNEKISWKKGVDIYRVYYNDFPEKIKGIKVKIVRRGILAIWNLFGKSYVINKAIKTVNARHKIDVVHFCNSESLAFFKSKKIPAVVRLSNYPAVMRHAQMPVFDYEKSINDINLVEKVQLMAIKKAKRIFAPSYNIAKLTEQKIKRKVQVIESPFYINAEKLDDSLYNQNLTDKKYFMFYGTLSYLKGVHTLAEALVKFFGEYPEYFFVFVGNNSKMLYRNKEMDAIDYVYEMLPDNRKHVLFFPAMNNKEQLYALIRHAQACVLPYRFDNLANTCIESMALGQIVIGTDGASFEQLIKDNYNGFLVERENAEQIYQKMKQVLKMTEEEKAKMKDRARESIARMNPEVIYEKVMDVYQATAGETV